MRFAPVKRRHPVSGPTEFELHLEKIEVLLKTLFSPKDQLTLENADHSRHWSIPESIAAVLERGEGRLLEKKILDAFNLYLETCLILSKTSQEDSRSGFLTLMEAWDDHISLKIDEASQIFHLFSIEYLIKRTHMKITDLLLFRLKTNFLLPALKENPDFFSPLLQHLSRYSGRFFKLKPSKPTSSLADKNDSLIKLEKMSSFFKMLERLDLIRQPVGTERSCIYKTFLEVRLLETLKDTYDAHFKKLTAHYQPGAALEFMQNTNAYLSQETDFLSSMMTGDPLRQSIHTLQTRIETLATNFMNAQVFTNWVVESTKSELMATLQEIKRLTGSNFQTHLLKSLTMPLDHQFLNDIKRLLQYWMDVQEILASFSIELSKDYQKAMKIKLSRLKNVEMRLAAYYSAILATLASSHHKKRTSIETNLLATTCRSLFNLLDNKELFLKSFDRLLRLRVFMGVGVDTFLELAGLDMMESEAGPVIFKSTRHLYKDIKKDWRSETRGNAVIASIGIKLFSQNRWGCGLNSVCSAKISLAEVFPEIHRAMQIIPDEFTQEKRVAFPTDLVRLKVSFHRNARAQSTFVDPCIIHLSLHHWIILREFETKNAIQKGQLLSTLPYSNSELDALLSQLCLPVLPLSEWQPLFPVFNVSSNDGLGIKERALDTNKGSKNARAANETNSIDGLLIWALDKNEVRINEALSPSEIYYPLPPGMFPVSDEQQDSSFPTGKTEDSLGDQKESEDHPINDLIIQATIIRTLKLKKRVLFASILSEVKKTANRTFKTVLTRRFKENLEELLDNEYLSRDPYQRDLFVYTEY